MDKAVSVLSHMKTRPSVPTPTEISSDHADDEDTTFAKCLANELRKIRNTFIKNEVKLKLLNQIYDGQKGEASVGNHGGFVSMRSQVWRSPINTDTSSSRFMDSYSSVSSSPSATRALSREGCESPSPYS